MAGLSRGFGSRAAPFPTSNGQIMPLQLVRNLSLVALVVTATACSDEVGPERSRASLAGVYILASVNGQGLPSSDSSAPVSGSMYLWPTGHAERRVAYRLGDGRTQDVTATGTFRVEGQSVLFDLRGDDGAGPWTIEATIDGSSLVISYFGPADGTIVERYRRL
jgi:hypothetical protein